MSRNLCLEHCLLLTATIALLQFRTTPTARSHPTHLPRCLLNPAWGDHPMSASITSDHDNLPKRATMLTYIFSNQGWGIFAGSLVTIIMMLCRKSTVVFGRMSKVNGRAFLFAGMSLIPAFATLYYTLSESTKYINDQQHETADHGADGWNEKRSSEKSDEDVDVLATPVDLIIKDKAHFKAAFQARVHVGSCLILRELSSSWFVFLHFGVSSSFHCINLKQNIILQQTSYNSSSDSPWCVLI
ncbi:hypothetical protein BDN70DRAFT_925619 [Pholiota conissans]|uniref:Uncharacterized protein n=1 Tax=Pholiota conissans TaxID=109636 RepID=A0A9P5YMQ4_9AGAR|nr:hypothetical protein BDN70DRAFT_925619 [Pholiota conissans]